MILDESQRDRLFSILDPLTEYANERLGVVEPGRLSWRTDGRMDADAQAQVLLELWENRQVIDDFMRDCASELSGWQIDALLDWRRMRKTTYIVTEAPDGTPVFMTEGWLFDVAGISREVAPMLSAMPSYVKTVLLPFEGLITYAEAIVKMDIGTGEGLAAIIESDVERSYREHGIVADAAGLVEASKTLEDTAFERAMVEMQASVEQYENGGELPTNVGCHRSFLADMDYDAREKAIEQHGGSDVFGSPGSRLRSSCEQGPLKSRLAELIEIERKDDLVGFCYGIGLVGVAQMKKAQVAARLAEFMVNDPNYLSLRLADIPLWRLKPLRRLVAEGGRMTVDSSTVMSVDDLPARMFGLCYLFRKKTEVTFVMPDEIVEVLDLELFDECMRVSESHEHAVKAAETLVALRGMVTIDEALAEYERLYPDDPFSHFVEGETALYAQARRRTALYEILEAISDEDVFVDEELEVGDVIDVDVQETYLLHHDLAREYRRQESGMFDEFEDENLMTGPLGDLLKGLLAAQLQKDPRPADADMLKSFGLYSWKMRQPCVEKLRRFLDSNVPDGEDDYYYADNVIRDVLEEAKWGSVDADALQRYLAIMEKHRFVPDDDHVQPLLDCLMAVVNGLPVWPNNGWAPLELMTKRTAGAGFLNEDGTPRKVGRNDPCPCGSGKKYKRCCGR